MDKELLKYYIAKNGDSIKELADFLGLHATTLYKKMNGCTDFSSKEVSKIAKRYDLSDSVIVDIFL